MERETQMNYSKLEQLVEGENVVSLPADTLLCLLDAVEDTKKIFPESAIVEIERTASNCLKAAKPI